MAYAILSERCAGCNTPHLPSHLERHLCPPCRRRLSASSSMSDLDAIKAMLLRAGYTEKPGEDGGAMVFADAPRNLEPGEGLGAREFAHHTPAAAGHPYPQSIELGQGEHGYAGFAVSLFFDEEGRFAGHASWE